MTFEDRKELYSSIPESLRQHPNWVAFKVVHIAGRRKPAKIPYAGPGKSASTVDPKTWMDFDAALELFASDTQFDGLGFCAREPFFLIDLDSIRNVETGEIVEWASEIIVRLNSYSEVSPSGTGVHVLSTHSDPRLANIGTRKDGIEMYGKDRFFTMTGEHLDGTPEELQDRTKELLALHREYFPAQGTAV